MGKARRQQIQSTESDDDCKPNGKSKKVIRRKRKYNGLRHNCSKCSASFTSSQYLKYHFDSIHLKKSFSCDICKKVFSREDGLARHKRTHHKISVELIEKKLEGTVRKVMGKARLQIAGKGKSSKKLNFTSKSKSQKVKCSFCHGGFSHQGNLNRHLKYGRCPGNDTAQGPSTSRSGEPKLHLRDVKVKEIGAKSLKVAPSKMSGGAESEEKPYKCEVCNAGYKFKRSLRKHMRKNKGPHEPPSKNGQRKISLSKEDMQPKGGTIKEKTRYSLRKIRTPPPDIGNAPKQVQKLVTVASQRRDCIQCGESFDTRDSLKIHHVTVHKRTIHECTHCSWWYLSKTKFNYHNAKKHNKMMVYKCSECPRKFPSYTLWRNHKNEQHLKSKFKCTRCQQTYGTLDNLQRHQRKCGHPQLINEGRGSGGAVLVAKAKELKSGNQFKCTRCQQTYGTLGNLRRHQRSSGHSQLLAERHKIKAGNDRGMVKVKGHRDQGQRQAIPEVEVRDEKKSRSGRALKPKKIFSPSSSPGKDHVDPAPSTSSSAIRRVLTPPRLSSSSDYQSDSEYEDVDDEDDPSSIQFPNIPTFPTLNGYPTLEQQQQMDAFLRAVSRRNVDESRLNPMFFLHMNRYKPDP